jgi:glycine/D-amino acid oxidase-like deaminating enzyme
MTASSIVIFMADSLWLDETAEPLPSRRLEGPVDVAIVGGGVTGCSCALALARAGLRVRLHEAREIAGGASGRNGGFALRGGAMPYDLAGMRLGARRALELWRVTEGSLDELEALAGDAFRRVGSLRLAADEAELSELRAEYDALRADGLAVDWLDELPAPLPRRYVAGLWNPPDGAIQPVRWVRRLAAHAAEAGADIREQSRANALDELGAYQVVIATDGYTRGLVPELDAVVRPTRNQVVATEPLSERPFPFPHYARHGFEYWQQTPDGRLVVGGWRDASVATEWTAAEDTTPLIQGHIERWTRDLLGYLPRITHRWAGLFGSVEDRLPLAGRLPGREGVWAACGYSGQGNVLGFLCGKLVGDAILGQEAPILSLFDPARLL